MTGLGHDPARAISDDLAVDDAPPIGAVRKTVEWVVIAAMVGAVVFGCSKTATTDATTPAPSSEISGELGKTVDRVVGDLDKKAKDCIEKSKDGVAIAAAECVDRADLASQVVNQVKAMGITDEPFLTCVQKSVEGLSNSDLEKLAGGTDKDAMSKLFSDISSCLGSSRPATRKFSSVGSAIS